MAASRIQALGLPELIREVFTSLSKSSTLATRSTALLCRKYQLLDSSEKIQFLDFVGKNHTVNLQQCVSLAKHFISENDNDVKLKLVDKLHSSFQPEYRLLFTEMAKTEDGVHLLASMRATILEFLKARDTANEDLRLMDLTLKELLSLWFSTGLLKLERVTWKTPADVLDRVSSYELVQPIRNLSDLRRRVGAYRRCFIFTHLSMPREPMVILHTALTNEISDQIGKITREPLESNSEDLSKVNTAIFYSINSPHQGLQGIDLGHYLLQQAVVEIRREISHINTFSSLSPIPGFRSWLLSELKKEARRTTPLLLLPAEKITLQECVGGDSAIFHDRLIRAIHTNSWNQNEPLQKSLHAPLLRLCARYLCLEKRRGLALNAVANFHCKNGAQVFRINWLADTSPSGLSNSCGLMVNYRYYLEKLESNMIQYLSRQTMDLSDEVRALLVQSKL